MYFLKRILLAVPLLLLISLMAFTLVRLAPGGPFDRERRHIEGSKNLLKTGAILHVVE